MHFAREPNHISADVGNWAGNKSLGNVDTWPVG